MATVVDNDAAALRRDSDVAELGNGANRKTYGGKRVTVLNVSKRRISMAVQANACADGLKEMNRIDSVISESDEDGGKLTVNDGVSNLVIGMVGAAIVVFPGIMADVGAYATPVLLAACCFFLMECGVLICQACEMAEGEAGGAPGSMGSYEKLAEAVGMGRFLALSKNMVMVGTLTVFINFLSDSFTTFFQIPPEDVATIQSTKTNVRWLLVTPLSLALAMLKDLTQLAKFGAVGLLGVAMECGGVLCGCALMVFTDEYGPKRCANMKEMKDLDTQCRWYTGIPPTSGVAGILGVAMAAFTFGFAILATVPSVRGQLQEPGKMPIVIRRSFLIALALYGSVMIVGYIAFGQKVNEDNVIVGLANFYGSIGMSWLPMIPSIGLILNILFSFPIFIYCIMSAFEAGGDDALHTPLSPPNIGIRVCLVVVIAFVGWVLPFIVPVIGVFSSIFCVCNNIFFPLIFFYKLRAKTGKHHSDPLPVAISVFHVLLALIGIFSMCFGLSGAIVNLIEKLGGNNPPTMNADKE